MENMIKQPKAPKPPKPESVVKSLFNRYKKMGLYMLISLLLFVGIAVLGGYVNESIHTYLIIQVLILGLGILHTLVMYPYLDWTKPNSFWREALFTLSLALIGVIAFLFIPMVKRLAAPPSNYTWALFLFLLPFFFRKAFDYWLRIPKKVYRKWYYPYEDEVPVIEVFEREINLLIQKGVQDEEYHKMEIVVPLDKTLGQVMHYLMFAYNRKEDLEHPIEVAENNNSASLYGWLFSSKPIFLLPKRYLDTNKTIRELKIKENATVIADRIFHLEFQ